MKVPLDIISLLYDAVVEYQPRDDDGSLGWDAVHTISQMRRVDSNFYNTSWSAFGHAVSSRKFKFVAKDMNHLLQLAQHPELQKSVTTLRLSTPHPCDMAAEMGDHWSHLSSWELTVRAIMNFLRGSGNSVEMNEMIATELFTSMKGYMNSKRRHDDTKQLADVLRGLSRLEGIHVGVAYPSFSFPWADLASGSDPRRFHPIYMLAEKHAWDALQAALKEVKPRLKTLSFPSGSMNMWWNPLSIWAPRIHIPTLTTLKLWILDYPMARPPIVDKIKLSVPTLQSLTYVWVRGLPNIAEMTFDMRSKHPEVRRMTIAAKEGYRSTDLSAVFAVSHAPALSSTPFLRLRNGTLSRGGWAKELDRLARLIPVPIPELYIECPTMFKRNDGPQSLPQNRPARLISAVQMWDLDFGAVAERVFVRNKDEEVGDYEVWMGRRPYNAEVWKPEEIGKLSV